jgi:cytosine/adenosine deaminase-related metal-dependent hydrolase
LKLLRADTLITGATIITMDAGRRVLTDGAVAIAGDRIVAVGKAREVARIVEAREVIDARRFVITPGFINGHVHITEAIFKGFMPENLGFDDGVWKWSVPLHEGQDAAEQGLGAKLAAVSMLRTGTTCFLEAGTVIAMEAVFRAVEETGIRARIGKWVLDRAFSPGQNQAALTDAALRELEAELAAYPGADGQRVAAWPLLIGHNTNTDALWIGAKALADSHKAGISAHMSPAPGDAAWYVAATGDRPAVHLARLGVLGSNVSLTHMVHVDDDEVAALAETGTHVIHCPVAAIKGAYGTSQVGRFPEMAAAGVFFWLGTDGADTADLMRPMTLMAGLFKDARGDGAVFPAHEALEMVTVNAARAMGMGAEIGALAPGMKADLVLHDIDRPEWRPLLNAVSQLVWCASGAGVHSVWVDGKRVVEDYRCTTIDEDKLFAEVQVAAEAYVGRSGLPTITAWPVT